MRPLLVLVFLFAAAASAQEPPPVESVPPPPLREPHYRSPSIALPQEIGKAWDAYRVADEVGPPLAGEVSGGAGTLRYADDRNGATRVDLIVQRDTVYAVEIYYEGREDWLAEQWEELQREAPASGARGFVSLVPFGRSYRARVQAAEGRVRLEYDAEGIRAGLAPPPVPPARPREYPRPAEPPAAPRPPMTSDAPPPLPPPPPEPGEPEIFDVVEQRPVLIGGLAGLQERVVYPLVAEQAGIEGKVFVLFIIDERGRVTDPVAIRCPNSLLCEEAVRVVQASTFEPGRQRGRPVKVRFTLPVDFKLR